MQIPELRPDDPPPRGKIRTHLANERTFLAWARTGFTAIALGLGSAQLLDSHTAFGIQLDKALAASLVVFGMLIVVVGRWRYRSTAIGIRDEEYRTHRRGLEVVLVGTVLVTAISFAFVWQS
jgi:putative membrane protein